MPTDFKMDRRAIADEIKAWRALGAAGAGRHLVADQSPAAPRQDGRAACDTARYYWLLLAESHLTRRLFGSMLRRIWALPVPTG